MRVAFCGKGGSGKTTLSALFIRFLLSNNLKVLAIDGDINQNLFEGLNIPQDKIKNLPKIGNDDRLLKEYIKGENPRIQGISEIIESTPPARGSNFIRFGDTQNKVWNYYTYNQDNLFYSSIGGHDEEDIAKSCYHRYTAVEGIFLNHLIDQEGQYVVGDKVAGADPFSSCGIASRYDLIFLVVEPTKKSLEVFNQINPISEKFGLDIQVIGNKIESNDDINFIKSHTGDKFFGYVQYSKFVKDADKGIVRPISELEPHNILLMQRIKEKLDSVKRDWDKYLEVGLKYHKIYAESWGEQWIGKDVMEQVDPEFSYYNVLN